MKKLYHKLCRILSVKTISWTALALFFILLIPVLYLSFVNRAAGDDYGYGTYTRAAWAASHSLIQVGRAAWKTIVQYYYGWQGTWFSIFLFSLQPEVFHPGAYVVTAFLMLFLWIGSTSYLFKYLLWNRLKLHKSSVLLLIILFMTVSIEWIPSTKSSIFWYNGAAHYMIPYVMCIVLTVWLFKYAGQYKWRYLMGSVVFMILLGGANYLASLLALIAACYIGIYDYFNKKNKKIFYLLIPIVLEIIGLIVSMKAPGNKSRGGEDFGFSFSLAVRTIAGSFEQSFMQVWQYLKEKPMVFIGLFIIFLFLTEAFLKRDEKIPVKHPVILCIFLWCLFSAMYAPELYAGVEVSGGVYNMYYQVFLLVVCGMLVFAADRLAERIRKYRGKQTELEENTKCFRFHQKAVLPGILLCLVLCVLCRSDMKESTTYVSLEYIVSGQAADYKEQMDLQTRLMMAEDVEDVVVPMINDVQGPLMHMPVTADKDAWSNGVTADFYGKNSVVGVPRAEWDERYGK